MVVAVVTPTVPPTVVLRQVERIEYFIIRAISHVMDRPNSPSCGRPFRFVLKCQGLRSIVKLRMLHVGSRPPAKPTGETPYRKCLGTRCNSNRNAKTAQTSWCRKHKTWPKTFKRTVKSFGRKFGSKNSELLRLRRFRCTLTGGQTIDPCAVPISNIAHFTKTSGRKLSYQRPPPVPCF